MIYLNLTDSTCLIKKLFLSNLLNSPEHPQKFALFLAPHKTNTFHQQNGKWELKIEAQGTAQQRTTRIEIHKQ
jgi:hypothetical protein